MSDRQHWPFENLGSQLKKIREKLKESLAEVSGAVEIDVDKLRGYEQGMTRPAEDILLLLISHFGVKEAEGRKLWELAGYDPVAMNPDSVPPTADDNPPTASVLVVPIDPRITYTDRVQVSVNDYGVVINFMQDGTSKNQPITIGRVGMSKDHVKSLIEILQKTLKPTQPKALPPSTKRPKRSQKQNKTDQ